MFFFFNSCREVSPDTAEPLKIRKGVSNPGTLVILWLIIIINGISARIVCFPGNWYYHRCPYLHKLATITKVTLLSIPSLSLSLSQDAWLSLWLFPSMESHRHPPPLLSRDTISSLLPQCCTSLLSINKSYYRVKHLSNRGNLHKKTSRAKELYHIGTGIFSFVWLTCFSPLRVQKIDERWEALLRYEAEKGSQITVSQIHTDDHELFTVSPAALINTTFLKKWCLCANVKVHMKLPPSSSCGYSLAKMASIDFGIT